MKLEGVLTALVTPMRGDGIDTEALERLVDEQIQAGIDGLVPCGTTGESPTLSHAEHLTVVEIVVRATRGRVPVLAGAGSNSTKEACELATACKELGADATLQITPYYNKPTQSGLVAHFTAIAEASGLPMVLYNVPGRTGCDLKPATLAELARHPLVVGVKEATGDMIRAARIRELCGEGLSLLSGDDFTLLPFLSLGGHGVISVGSNVAPGLFVALCRAAREGRWDEARALHYRQLPLSRALFSVTSPEPIKAAMAMLGKIEPTIRLPLQVLPDDHPTRAELRRVLDTLELRP
ncbi:4-hydroxy-tetrahydrodipicolinate synthase [Paraliomyxa miuraensis]|uniref:4-hydroxy-tetrahydrodipicolinate synthase n=1 Tax=Paraliomyxa miuraensis TaxID=376150 RepID=UPI002256D4B1|nr:4-hydroxy-tetrahydrodipicolinate synthase [Paraliomyxa miuraensis]MCX4243243.1 4-hydroxy-tetrahydrodipicolinate synthase [Paraliomyxa miuraensis]